MPTSRALRAALAGLLLAGGAAPVAGLGEGRPEVRLLAGEALGAERELEVVAETTGAAARGIALFVDGVEVARVQGARLAATVALAWPPRPQRLEALALDAAGCPLAAALEFLRHPQRRTAIAVLLVGEGCDESGPWAWVFARPPAGTEIERLRLAAGAGRIGESAGAPAAFQLSGRDLAQPFLAAEVEASDGSRAEATLARGATGLGESLEVRRALARRALSGRAAPAGARVSIGGVAQRVVAVESGRELPLELGVALDESLSMLPLAEEALALAAATGRELAAHPGSREFLVRFDERARVAEMAPGRPQSVSPAEPRFGTTAIYDALATALHEFEAAEERAALVAVTDGCDTASRGGADDVLAIARARGVPIYVLLFDRAVCPGDADGGRPATAAVPEIAGRARTAWGESRQRLERIARQSGGRLFGVAHRRDLSGIWRRIVDELARQVVVVFEPSGPEVDPAAVEVEFEWR